MIADKSVVLDSLLSLEVSVCRHPTVAALGTTLSTAEGLIRAAKRKVREREAIFADLEPRSLNLSPAARPQDPAGDSGGPGAAATKTAVSLSFLSLGFFVLSHVGGRGF